MNEYCLLMPDRGDRPQLTEFVISRLPKDIPLIHVNYKPERNKPDLTQRIRRGVERAKAEGFTKVFVAENDDFYKPDYFKPFDADFVGESVSTYYNLRNRTHEELVHAGRASLYTTGFKIEALKSFRWPIDTTMFLDIQLWDYARRMRKSVDLKRRSGAIGIKHGMGMCGGKGHVMKMANYDGNLEWLQSQVDKEAFDFYRNLIPLLK